MPDTPLLLPTQRLSQLPRCEEREGRSRCSTPEEQVCCGAGSWPGLGIFGGPVNTNQEGAGHGEGACLKPEPVASRLASTLSLFPLSPDPCNARVSQRSRPAGGECSAGVERDGLLGGAFQAFFTSLGVRPWGWREREAAA